MDIHGDITLGLGYANPTQQVRKISEAWIAGNGYCLRCDSDSLTPTRANTRSRDFVCDNCGHGYELKSKCGVFSTRVLDGAYVAMVKTIREGNTPTFLLLEYSTSWSIKWTEGDPSFLDHRNCRGGKETIGPICKKGRLDRLQHRATSHCYRGPNFDSARRRPPAEKHHAKRVRSSRKSILALLQGSKLGGNHTQPPSPTAERRF